MNNAHIHEIRGSHGCEDDDDDDVDLLGFSAV